MKWRFMGAIVLVTLIVVLVQDIPLSGYLRQVEHDRIITALERDAFVLAGRSEEALEDSTEPSLESLTSAAKTYRDAGGARVVITDATGTAVVTSDDDQSSVGDSYASRPEIAKTLTGTITSGTRFSDTLQEELLYVTVPVLSGERVLGAVRLTYPAAVVGDVVDGQVRVLWIVALTTVLLAGLVGWIFSSTVTRRLVALREATEALANGRLDARADDSSGAPELRSLSRSFNTMAARLQSLIDQQRAFAADASHQLRTPLTALRLRLERSRELLETDPAAATERLAAAEAEVDRLGNIIEGLLVLSRAEAREAVVEPIDLAAVVLDRVAHWRPLAQESGVTLRFTGRRSARGMAVATAPEQIIDNYLDNALSVSPAGSTITIAVEADDDQVSVHIIDEGPGLHRDDRERAFDRFWRGRSDAGGSGLGLAIVAQLAMMSGAVARLDEAPSGGVDASIRFEAARS